MLIIEGSDCLGKTTLANKICSYVNEIGFKPAAFVRHMTRPDENTFDFYTDYFPMVIPNVIQDRFHLGGLAYHDDKITAERLRIIEGWIYSHGGLIIVLYCSDFRLYHELLVKDKRSSILTKDKQEEANKRFYGMVKCNKHALIDIPIDIAMLGKIVYPNEEIVQLISDEWLKRRKEYYNGISVL